MLPHINFFPKPAMVDFLTIAGYVLGKLEHRFKDENLKQIHL